MTFALGQASLAHLVGVHPDLVRVVQAAIAISAVDFMVIEGVRSPARQAELYAQGRAAPGQIVTWVTTSNHEPKPDGFGHAVDIAPFIDGQIVWNDETALRAVYDAMFDAAKALGVGLRSGWDWNRNGVLGEHGEADKDHYELAIPVSQIA